MFFKNIKTLILSLAIGQFFSYPVLAQTPKFIFPAACIYGVDCWAVNYVDVDPDNKIAQDFKCGPKSYNAHKGTDFALGSIAQMNRGVDVLAAAAGKILRLRDGEDDILKNASQLQATKDSTKECGNGVMIDHGNGLQTIYCHLKKDSIIVRAKQSVRAGQKIGQIGQSGFTEFPHLHFGVMSEGGVIDPYTGSLDTQGCGQMGQSNWHIGLPMDYEPVVIFDGGFRASPPNFESIKRGEENPLILSIKSKAFVFWVGFYNVEKGDQITLEILDPNGKIFNQRREIVEKTRARQYYFTGKKIGKVQLKDGAYTAKVKIIRQGKDQGLAPISKEKKFSVTVQ